MNRRSLLKAAATIALCSVFPGVTAASAWIALGRRRISGSNSGGTVRFPVTEGQLRRFRIGISGGSARIEAIEIQLTDGSRQLANVKRTLQAGEYSPSIRLPAGNRAVRFIEVRYGKYSDGRGGTYLHLWAKG